MAFAKVGGNGFRATGLTLMRSYGSATSSGKRMDISGIYPPITTPFDSKGSIDYTALRRNFDHWNTVPFAGLFDHHRSCPYLHVLHQVIYTCYKYLYTLLHPTRTHLITFHDFTYLDSNCTFFPVTPLQFDVQLVDRIIVESIS